MSTSFDILTVFADVLNVCVEIEINVAFVPMAQA
jgi:hypothetical protein